MDDSNGTFSAGEAATAQEALRRSLGLGPERFSLGDFIGMLSDEIERFREQGRPDSDVAAAIKAATGREVTVADIAAHYAPPEARRHGPA